MVDDDISVNIEWKQDKNGENNSRISRRLDEKKAALFNKKAPNKLDVGVRNLEKAPVGLKKIRSKIREVFDEDEDDEYETDKPKAFDFDNEANYTDSSLLHGLNEEEKQKLQVDETIHNQNMQQNAGKMMAIMEANRLASQNGLKNIEKKIVNQTMLNVNTDINTFNDTLTRQLNKEEKIKTPKTSSYKSTTDLVKGLGKAKKIEKLDDIDKKRVDKLEVEDLIELGREKNNEKVAKTILKKTGRKEEGKNKIDDKKEKINAQNKIKEALKQKTISEKESRSRY